MKTIELYCRLLTFCICFWNSYECMGILKQCITHFLQNTPATVRWLPLTKSAIVSFMLALAKKWAVLSNRCSKVKFRARSYGSCKVGNMSCRTKRNVLVMRKHIKKSTLSQLFTIGHTDILYGRRWYIISSFSSNQSIFKSKIFSIFTMILYVILDLLCSVKVPISVYCRCDTLNLREPEDEDAKKVSN